MTKSYAEEWGSGTLRDQMFQIGNNAFPQHGDLERFVQEKNQEAEHIQRRIQARPDEVGVEIGSGTGVHTRFMAERSRLLWAVDVSDHWLELFGRMTAGRENIRRLRSDGFPFLVAIPDASVDYAFSSAVFCHVHVYDVYLYFEELARVLKRGGRFYVNFQSADTCSFDDFFLGFLERYRQRGRAEPLEPTQMQYHSPTYFRNVGTRFGFSVAREQVAGSYVEMTFVKAGEPSTAASAPSRGGPLRRLFSRKG